ncbi:MAG: HAD family hydrolase [Deltaproteobacteria bacterium]|nr:HAD family hydrolase [Deltaproteobacteria bacterium]
MTSKKPAVFIDRDGTVNEQMGYINHPDRFIILPGVAEAFRILNKNGFLAIIVSNQSGVARGYFPFELVDDIHALMRGYLKKEDAAVDGIYFCPHHPRGAVPEYSVDCDCRKPKTGLIKKACEQFDIDMSRSYMVGDHYTDMELADRAALKGILVKTGYGRGVMEYNLPKMTFKPSYIAEDLLDAVKWIMKIEIP